jgi:diguanylate cyclase (GGDEF)-like protein
MPQLDPYEAASNGREREARQLALIHRIARISAENHSLRSRLQQIVRLLQSHLSCEFVACASIDLREGRFRCEALAADIPTVIHVGYGRELGSGVVGEVAATGQTLYVADVTQHPNYVETMPGTHSELCVAMRHNGEVMGVINAEAMRVDAFGDEIDLLETLAEQLAGMFAAERLNAEQRKRLELLSMLSEVSRVAIEADDLDQALLRVVHFLRDRFMLESVGVMLVDRASHRLRFKAHAGVSVFHGRSGGDWPETLGIIGRAYRSGEAQYVADVTQDPDYVLGNPAVTTEYVLPIRLRGSLIGLINLEASDPRALDETSRQMLTALADQVAGAVHLAATNARLREINRLVEEKSAALTQVNQRLREANQQLEQLSHRDGLTGIANRRRFDEVLASEWGRAQRHSDSIALLLLDIDDFKSYNDGYGHLAGDDALRQVARALGAALSRAEDCVARYGGEEFAVLLPQSSLIDAQNVASHVAHAIEQLALPHAYSRAAAHLTVSIGVAALVPHADLDALTLVTRADGALYRAKTLGRNRIESAATSFAMAAT